MVSSRTIIFEKQDSPAQNLVVIPHKANRQLGFIKRNIQYQNSKREVAYMGLVRPILEYCHPYGTPITKNT
jgi:hypothetical protein